MPGLLCCVRTGVLLRAQGNTASPWVRREIFLAWSGEGAGIGHSQGRRLVLGKELEVGGQGMWTGRATPSSHGLSLA